MADVPPKMIIDLWKTTTLNTFHISKNTHIPSADIPPPINHRSMEHHYTAYVSHIEGYTYTYDRCTPPPSINHRSMEDHNTA